MATDKYQNEIKSQEKRIRSKFKHVRFLADFYKSEDMVLRAPAALAEVLYELDFHPDIESGKLYLASRQHGELFTEFMVYKPKVKPAVLLILIPKDHQLSGLSAKSVPIARVLAGLNAAKDHAIKKLIPAEEGKMYGKDVDHQFVYLPEVATRYATLEDPGFAEDLPIVVGAGHGETRLIVVRSRIDSRLYVLVPKSSIQCGFYVEVAMPPFMP